MLTIADFSEMKKLVITMAITGGIHGKEANPHLPEKPDEQAKDAYNCYNKVASIFHLHVRDREGKTTGELNRYTEAISKIKARCPILWRVREKAHGPCPT
jgi:3-keto-5-aminohexanoate cleavage enzyme